MSVNSRGISGKIILPVLLAGSFFAASVHAGTPQEPLTLRALVDEALRNNPEIKAARDLVRSKEARAKAEGVLDDPTFKVEMGDLSRTHPLNIAPGNAMLTRYTIAQSFPSPGKLSLKERIAGKEALTTEAGLHAKELEIGFMVKDAFYDYSLANELLKAEGELKEILSFMSKIAGARYSTGQATQQDVIKVQLETTMLTNELTTLEAEKGVAAARLKLLLNRPQDAAIGEPPSIPKGKFEIRTNELVGRAITGNPQIKSMEYEVQAGELTADLASRNYYPDIMVGAAPVQRDGRFDSWDLMFQVNIPIWRSKYGNLTQEAASNAASLRSRLVNEKNIKSFEIKEAALKAESAARVITLYETGLIPQAQVSFESALKNYQSGKVDFLTLLDTERALKKVRIDYINSLADYRKKIARLELAVGADIDAPDESSAPEKEKGR